MDPATVFLLWLVGVLSIWLLGTVVQPTLAAVSRLGILLPVGRRFAAVLVTIALIGGVARTATASVGPPSHRMSQMVERSPVSEPNHGSILHYPMLGASSGTYTVVAGDSLWKIAHSVLNDRSTTPSGGEISMLWRSIYDLNEALIGNDPNLIHPGQVLQLPGR